MALAQAGMGLTKVVVLVGAGVAGSVVIRNGRLAEILGDLQEILDKASKGKGGGRADGGEDELNEQVRRLAMEVRRLANPRPVIINGSSVQSGVSGLLVPAATVGALGYGYMWWKGISFSDLMYVTKRNMANAVSTMTKHLEQVQSSLAVTDARLKLESIGSEIKNIKDLVWGLDGKIDSMEAKQDFSCAGVMYLCQFIEQNGGKLPERLEGPKVTAKRYGGQKVIQGLQLAIESGNFGKDTINALINDSDSSDKLKR
nr:unnamed protein product [Digitaria exilis]